MKSKIKTILIVILILLFYVVGIILLRMLPYEIRSTAVPIVFGVIVSIIMLLLGIGSYLSPCGRTVPQSNKAKLGDCLVDIAFALRLLFVALIPFFFAAIIV